jgi:hypothetical protein
MSIEARNRMIELEEEAESVLVRSSGSIPEPLKRKGRGQQGRVLEFQSGEQLISRATAAYVLERTGQSTPYAHRYIEGVRLELHAAPQIFIKTKNGRKRRKLIGHSLNQKSRKRIA